MYRAHRLKCFEDYFPGISALLDRAQWGETGTIGETERTDREGETVRKKFTNCWCLCVCVLYVLFWLNTAKMACRQAQVMQGSEMSPNS